jgi:hypothetical protein
MTRIAHHLLRTGACLIGGLLAIGAILVAAVASAVLAAALTLVRCIAPKPTRVSGARVPPRPALPAQPAPRAEPAL